MSSDTSETKDVQETTDGAQESAGAAKPLGPTGKKAMRGEPPGTGTTDSPGDASTDAPAKLDGKAESQVPGIGAPNQMTDTPQHNQGNQPDCLLQSARMAEHRQTGQDPGLAAYKDPAVGMDIYKPGPNGGVTSLEGFAAIINERPGVAAELKTGTGPQDIKDPLDKGESVIACVDAYEYGKALGLQPQRSGAGHAVVVTGADQAPNGSWQFTVNDPNNESSNVPVDGSGFLRAWNARGYQMITLKSRGGG